MKNLLIKTMLLTFALFSIPSIAQEGTVIKSDEFNFLIIVKYSIENSSFSVNVQDNDNQEKYNYYLATIDVNSLTSLISKDLGLKDSTIEKLDSIISNKYPAIMEQAFSDHQSGQIISKVSVKDTVLLHHFNSANKTDQEVDIIVNHVRMVFEDGFISSIQAVVEIEKQKFTYSTIIPIGISTRRAIVNLSCMKLFCQDRKNDPSYILVGELLTYKNYTDVKTKDYSPKNQCVTIIPGQDLTLRKNSEHSIFEVRAFTDFAGINNENPNGLIQFELDKKINFNTHRYQLETSGIGFFTYFKPSFTYSKVEQNNRFAPLINYTDSISSILYTSPLEMNRYQIFQAALDMNVFDVDGSAAKLSIDALAGVAQSKVLDSSTTKTISETVNSAFWGGKVEVAFCPSKSWGLTVSSRMIQYTPLNENILYNSLEGGKLSKANKWLNRFEMSVFWKYSKDSQIFARVRFNHEVSYWRNNYSEIQLGTSFSLHSKLDKK